jgi:hypothetical protein
MTLAPTKTYLWIEDSYYQETLLEVISSMGSHLECDITMNEEVMRKKVEYDEKYRGTKYEDKNICPKKWSSLYRKVMEDMYAEKHTKIVDRSLHTDKFKEVNGKKFYYHSSIKVECNGMFLEQAVFLINYKRKITGKKLGEKEMGKFIQEESVEQGKYLMIHIYKRKMIKIVKKH